MEDITITEIPIRANIFIGSLHVKTPHVQSFNVRKQRGQVSTFDASLKVESGEVTGTIAGGSVKVYAGTYLTDGYGDEDLIFTGMCRSAKISPCYDDPRYVILSVSGADAMSLLNGKKYTRRCRSTKSTWVAITGVTRDGLKSGKFAYQNEPTIEISPGVQEASDSRTGHSSTAPDSKGVNGLPANKNTVNPPPVNVEIIENGDT